MSSPSEYASFWDHLDELRSRLVRMVLVVVAFSIVAFLFKEPLFSVILAPRSSAFVSYRLLGVSTFAIHLINTGLTEQFMVHMRTSGLLALPMSCLCLARF